MIQSFRERYSYALAPADSATYGTAEQFRALYPDSFWTANLARITNEDGSLAWSTTQDMLALAEMYDLTSDRWFLDWLARYADAVMRARDDLSGKKDHDGRSDPGWGSSRYGNLERRIYLVHSGLIVEPLLEYVLRARKADGAADAKALDALVERCRQTLVHHDYQLDPASPPGQSVYLSGREEPERRNSWQPFNRQNLFARDFHLLYQATGDEQYLERSRKLYAFFRSHVELTPSNAYVWEYEPNRLAATPTNVLVCDDVSHASYTIEPVVAAARDRFVFDDDDVLRLANTFTKHIHLGGGVFQTSIGCRVTFAPRMIDRLFAWLPVSQADPRVYWLIRRFYIRNVEKPTPLAVAYLAAYRPKGLAGVDTRAR